MRRSAISLPSPTSLLLMMASSIFLLLLAQQPVHGFSSRGISKSSSSLLLRNRHHQDSSSLRPSSALQAANKERNSLSIPNLEEEHQRSGGEEEEPLNDFPLASSWCRKNDSTSTEPTPTTSKMMTTLLSLWLTTSLLFSVGSLPAMASTPSLQPLTSTSTMTLSDNQNDPIVASSSVSSSSSSWFVKDPINPKRNSRKVTDAETVDGYNLSFVTYLSRLLLNFDPSCQAWWRQQAQEEIFGNAPSSLSADDIYAIRQAQFAKFSASVELSLAQEYGNGGTERLLQQLLQRYGTDNTGAGEMMMSNNKHDDSDATGTTTNPQQLSFVSRETKEARRQIALLFGLLPPETQPTQEITNLLASIDNGSVTQPVQLLSQPVAEVESDPLRGYRADDPPPQVVFAPPQALGLQSLLQSQQQQPLYEQATGTVTLEPTGQLLTIDVVDGGSGYDAPPRILISPPSSSGGRAATAIAKLKSGGTVQSIQVTDGGNGYTEEDKITVSVVADTAAKSQSNKRALAKNNNPTETRDAVLKPILEMKISKVEVTNPGSGYAVEKPLTVRVDVSSTAKAMDGGKKGESLIPIGTTYPQAEKTSFVASRMSGDNQVRNYEKSLLRQLLSSSPSSDKKSSETTATAVVSGTKSGGSLPPSAFVTGKASSSEQLLSLLPEGFGLEYDTTEKRYFLSVDQNYIQKNPAIVLQSGKSSRPLVPDFGPRGTSPIERDMLLDVNTFLRFLLAGAICTSSVYLLLTPLDVIKTKVQTNPAKYPTIGSSFGTVWKDEGVSTFFAGWLPTFVGHFVGGAVLYAVSEAIRRYLTDLAGVGNAASLEVPIILISAAISSAAAVSLFCPFDAVRIRTVAQPDYAPNSVEVTKLILKEEGFGSLVDAIPVFLAKQVPYAMTKFLIFDLSSEYLYRVYPVAQEDLRLSLLVSLLCGVVGGVAAACVSNPADMVIAELKKSKSTQGPQDAVRSLLERGGYAAFFTGLPLRMGIYALATSLQFSVYDGVRFALGVGADDLRLYFDVLGGALSTKGTIA